QESNGLLERGHIIVFPDRHMLVQVADQRFPPADHPPSGSAKKRQARLCDQCVVCRPLVRPHVDAPLAVNQLRLIPKRPCRVVRSSTRLRSEKCKQNARCANKSGHDRRPLVCVSSGGIYSAGIGSAARSSYVRTTRPANEFRVPRATAE